MTTTDDRAPRTIRVRAAGAGFPLHPEQGPQVGFSPDDPALGLSAGLAADLHAWAAEFPSADVRTFTRRGYELSARLAAELGPPWVVLCHDEVHDAEHCVCWTCGGFHWRRDPHGPPTGSRTVRVQAEFRCYPLRFIGGEQDGENFAPDDPVIALGLTDDLVDRLYAWSRELDELFDGRYYLTPDEEHRLAEQGRPLARQLADELGSGWVVEYHAVGS
jgi:hypothetical protein